MLKLVPDEPVTHYNLGFLHKVGGRQELALKHFETTAKLNPNLAGAHFQLFNAYRTIGRAEDAAREQALFRTLRNVRRARPSPKIWSGASTPRSTRRSTRRWPRTMLPARP